MKLLFDMNMSPRLVDYLRSVDFEATHWLEIGPATATDESICAYAADTGMTVVTHDLDFGALLARTNQMSPSVVQIRVDDLSVQALGEKLAIVLSDLSSEIDAGALVTIDPVKVRIRALPLRRQ